MSATVVVGLQWGDEGKGKIVDYLAAEADYVVRWNGGDNAGHAVKVAGQRFGFQLVPSAGLRPDVVPVIGPGVVVNPLTLLDEVEALEAAGAMPSSLVLSDRAQLLFPWHLQAERTRDQETTGRGIGPALADRVGRRAAVRLGELHHPAALARRVRSLAAERSRALGERFDPRAILALLRRFSRRFAPHIADTTRLLNEALDRGERVLLEGAQGALLDVDHGTCPDVTASTTVAGGACSGAGLSPRRISRVVGVLKAYTTRVGSGPFPSEARARDADRLRRRGLEVGTATGMLRRCGWLDLVALEHALLLDRPDALALTKLDVVASFPRIPVCVRYRIGRKTSERFPSDPGELSRARPVYEEVRGVEALVALVERRAGAPVEVLSFGAGREETRARASP